MQRKVLLLFKNRRNSLEEGDKRIVGFFFGFIIQTVLSFFILDNSCDEITFTRNSSFSFHGQFKFLRFSLVHHLRGKLYRRYFRYPQEKARWGRHTIVYYRP